jgi:hypothetical protein
MKDKPMSDDEAIDAVAYVAKNHLTRVREILGAADHPYQTAMSAAHGAMHRIAELEAELGRLREVASSLAAAADEAEHCLGDVAAYGSARADEGRIRTLLGGAIAAAREEQGQ